MANNNLPQSDNLKYTTDFEIESVGILCSAGAFDVTNFLVELSYFENLFSPCITGNLVLSDAAGLINMMTMHGNEYIKISFRKVNRQNENSQTETIDRTFRVVTISERSINSGNNYETYIIDFCSDEMVLSEQYRLSKSYKKKTISDILIDIMNNYLNVGVGKNGKNFFYENTDGVFDLVLPNKKIFDTISWLCRYAKSSQNKNGADMVFFETRLGYQFNSLQTLFSRPAVQTFTYYPKNLVDDNDNPGLNDDQKKILKLEMLNTFDTLKGTRKGTFSNRLISLNPLIRVKTKTDFNYSDYFNKSKKNGILNETPVINNMKNRFGKALYDAPPNNLESGPLRVFISNDRENGVDYIKNKPGSVSNNMFVENYMPNRTAQFQLAEYNKIKVVVAGYNELYVGMTVNIEIVITTTVTEKVGERIIDPYLSGKYLISAVRHLLSVNSYITVMELMKDSSSNYYVPSDDTNTLMNQVIQGSQT